CGTLDNRVVDSRLTQGGEVTRRRRECEGCGRRYTTHEKVVPIELLVVKNDGRREPFDRGKVLAGLQRACIKRPVPAERLEALVDELERHLGESGAREVTSASIGGWLLERLRAIDEVAYVRFASVYRRFSDARQFLDELTELLRASSSS
ncbi:MAG: transcriptional regulator NrdR, partial [Myxococcota bacterium]|nr:transcriptional regulator NrdR [Myxococcota bacterium]